MKKIALALATGLTLSAGAGFAGSADVGMLTCKLDGVKNDIVYSKEKFLCEFKMTDILQQINRKMIRRHPHVWGDVTVNGAEDVLVNWDQLKKQEHTEQGVKRESLLDGIPKGLPALMQAYEYQAKAAKPGFDWERIDDVIAKVREELDEVVKAETDAARAEEMGDLLFVLVNWARWLKVEPETALREANAKFYRRFRYIEDRLAEQGKALTDSNLAEMDALWNEAKGKGL